MKSGNPILDYLLEIITLKGVIIFGVLYFLIIWISIFVWVLRDIGNRTDKLSLKIISFLIILIFSPLGIFLYLLIRPGKNLDEQFNKEIENNLQCLSEEIVDKIGKKNLHIVKCNKCKKKISLEFKYCPYCKNKIDVLEIEDKKKKKSKKKKK